MKKYAASAAALLMAFAAAMPGTASATPANFSLTNNTDVIIIKLAYETKDGDEWGTTHEGRLFPGDTVDLTIDDGRRDCTYHFRVYYEDDGIKYRDYTNVNICDNPSFSVP